MMENEKVLSTKYFDYKDESTTICVMQTEINDVKCTRIGFNIKPKGVKNNPKLAEKFALKNARNNKDTIYSFLFEEFYPEGQLPDILVGMTLGIKRSIELFKKNQNEQSYTNVERVEI